MVMKIDFVQRRVEIIFVFLLKHIPIVQQIVQHQIVPIIFVVQMKIIIIVRKIVQICVETHYVDTVKHQQIVQQTVIVEMDHVKHGKILKHIQTVQQIVQHLHHLHHVIVMVFVMVMNIVVVQIVQQNLDANEVNHQYHRNVLYDKSIFIEYVNQLLVI
jgi:hypothetical protein